MWSGYVLLAVLSFQSLTNISFIYGPGVTNNRWVTRTINEVNEVKALICVPQVKEEEEVTYSTVKTAVQTGSRRWSQLPLQLRQQTKMNQRGNETYSCNVIIKKTTLKPDSLFCALIKCLSISICFWLCCADSRRSLWSITQPKFGSMIVLGFFFVLIAIDRYR